MSLLKRIIQTSHDIGNHVTPEEWRKNLLTLFQRPEAQLQMPIRNLIDEGTRKYIFYEVNKNIQDPNHSFWGNFSRAVVKGAQGDLPGAFVDSWQSSYKSGYQWGERKTINKVINGLHLLKPASALTQQEQQLVLSVGELHAHGALSPQLWLKHFPSDHFTGKTPQQLYGQVWELFLTKMVWSGGNCDIISEYSYELLGTLRQMLRQILEQQLHSHDVFLEKICNLVADTIALRLPGAKSAKEHLEFGDRFFDEDDLEDSSFVNADHHPNALRIGILPPNNTAIGLDRSTSIFVSAAPGAGKTQAFILNNLLSNKGAAFVIDYKGELVRDSGGWRADHCGPVFRFAPSSPTGNTAIYNPLDAIPADRMCAPVECQTIASTMISDENSNDNVWPLSAQRLVSALLTGICLCNWQEDLDIISAQVALNGRALPTVNNLLSLCSVLPHTDFVEEQNKSAPNIIGVIKSLDALGKQHNLPDLRNIADQMFGMASNARMRESVLLNARAGFGLFSSNPPLMKAIGGEKGQHESDWTPGMLRTQPGMSVYVTISAQQMKDYAPLLRLIIKQHLTALERLAEEQPPLADDAPCTFYLDEFARMSSRGTPFDEALHITEQGRGANIRAIYVTQGVGQLVEIWGRERAQSIVSACEAAIYLSPGMQEISWLKEILGNKRNIFTGEEELLEEIHNLRGRKYKDKALVVPNGESMMVLQKEMAFQHPIFSQRMKYQCENQE